VFYDFNIEEEQSNLEIQELEGTWEESTFSITSAPVFDFEESLTNFTSIDRAEEYLVKTIPNIPSPYVSDYGNPCDLKTGPAC